MCPSERVLQAVLFSVARACALVMGAKQTKEDETPTSPKSPRVSPVDIASDETPVPALLVQLPVYLVFKISSEERVRRTLPEDILIARRGKYDHYLFNLWSSTARRIVHDPLTFLSSPTCSRNSLTRNSQRAPGQRPIDPIEPSSSAASTPSRASPQG